MKKIVIQKGKHYPFPYFPIPLPFWVKKQTINIRKAKFMFTDSCMFDLVDEDQWDVNKLFGFSIGHHKKCTSFRFGWRPKLLENKIEIVAYEYHDGIRQATKIIGMVDLNTWYKCVVFYIPYHQQTRYIFGDLSLTTNFNLNKKSGLGYTLGIYFGGNERAPQKIIILKKKQKRWNLTSSPI